MKREKPTLKLLRTCHDAPVREVGKLYAEDMNRRYNPPQVNTIGAWVRLVTLIQEDSSMGSRTQPTQDPAQECDKATRVKPRKHSRRIACEIPIVFIRPCISVPLPRGRLQGPRNPLQTLEHSRDTGPAFWFSCPALIQRPP